MNKQTLRCSRRTFFRTALSGGALVMAGGPMAKPLRASTGAGGKTRVALTTGVDRPANIFQGLQVFRNEIARAIGDRRVVIKPNCVLGRDQPTWHPNGAWVELSDSHAGQIEGILEFLHSIGKTDIVIAESCATHPTFEAYEKLGYLPLARRYRARVIDLNQEDWKEFTVYSGNGEGAVRASRMLFDRDHYIISAAKMKTHDTVVATLALKNIVMCAPVQDVNGRRKDKSTMHGNSNSAQDLNDNLHLMARRGLVPDLAVIDGTEAMEGEGPIFGTVVDHRVALVSPDWLAADRVGLELMGIDPSWPAYLNYCASEGLGTFSLDDIEVVGPALADHRRTYKLHSKIEWQRQVSPLPRGQRPTPYATAPSAFRRYELSESGQPHSQSTPR